MHATLRASHGGWGGHDVSVSFTVALFDCLVPEVSAGFPTQSWVSPFVFHGGGRRPRWVTLTRHPRLPRAAALWFAQCDPSYRSDAKVQSGYLNAVTFSMKIFD